MKRKFLLLLTATTAILIGLPVVLLTTPPGKLAGQPPGKPEPRLLTPILVEKSSLTFNPATCMRGSAGFGWGLGSVQVNVLGRENGHCVFDFTNEIEGGYTVYRCQAPVMVKEVRIYEQNGDIQTSFDLKAAKIVGGGNLLMDLPQADAPRWTVQSVPGSGYVNYVTTRSTGKGAASKKGDQITIRYTLLADDLKTPLPGAGPQELTFAIGAGKVDPGIETAATGMQRGAVILAKIRSEVLPQLSKQLGGVQPQTQLVLQIKRLAK